LARVVADGITPKAAEGAHDIMPEVAHDIMPEGAHDIMPEVAHDIMPEGAYDIMPEGAHAIMPEGEHAIMPEGEHDIMPEVAHDIMPEGAHDIMLERAHDIMPKGASPSSIPRQCHSTAGTLSMPTPYNISSSAFACATVPARRATVMNERSRWLRRVCAQQEECVRVRWGGAGGVTGEAVEEEALVAFRLAHRVLLHHIVCAALATPARRAVRAVRDWLPCRPRAGAVASPLVARQRHTRAQCAASGARARRCVRKRCTGLARAQLSLGMV
jgi:hypothetical protein